MAALAHAQEICRSGAVLCRYSFVCWTFLTSRSSQFECASQTTLSEGPMLAPQPCFSRQATPHLSRFRFTKSTRTGVLPSTPLGTTHWSNLPHRFTLTHLTPRRGPSADTLCLHLSVACHRRAAACPHPPPTCVVRQREVFQPVPSRLGGNVHANVGRVRHLPRGEANAAGSTAAPPAREYRPPPQRGWKRGVDQPRLMTV